MSTAKTALTIDTSQLVDGPTETANATDVTTPLNDLLDHLKNGQVSVSSNDTHVKALNEALTVAGSGLSKAIQNGSGDEQLQLALANKLELLLALLTASGEVPGAAVDSTGAPSGYVLTANGSGGSSFAVAGGGGAEPIDIEVTAGEDLSLRDMVYLNEADGEWYKIDIDADPVACGPERGCVIEAGGISNGNTGTVRQLGEVDGFTGLTAMGRVWASSTAGGYTQTKPEPSLGGAQVALAEMGRATSTTAILIRPQPVQYMLASTLANDATATIKHHIDAKGRERTLKLYLASETPGSSLESYASSHQDTDVFLKGLNFSGDAIDTGGGASATGIGDYSGQEQIVAQSFLTTNGGQLTQFVLEFDSNIGSPTGDITWFTVADNSGDPDYGNAIDTGTFTPTPSATNTISGINGANYDAATTYWLVLEAPAQGTNNRYRVVADNGSSSYANGLFKYSRNGGSSWTAQGNGEDIDLVVTLSAVTEKDRLAQSFQLSSGESIGSVKLWLKKEGTPADNLTVKIMPDSTGDPSGTPVTNGTSDSVATSTLSTSYGWIEFPFSTAPSLSGSTTYWIVLETDGTQSDTDYVVWGADGSSPGYANGEGKSELASTWSAEGVDFIFDVLGVSITYDSPAAYDHWNTALATFAARFDDGSGSNANTQTTVKNVTGSQKDVIAMVELR